jgi:membrane protease YdiL (CAAX protease family)
MLETNPTRPPWPAWYGFGAIGLSLLVVFFFSVFFEGLLSLLGIHYGSHSPGVNLPLTIVQDVALAGSAVWLAARVAPPRPEQFGVRPTRLRLAIKWGLIAIAIYLGFQIAYVAAFHPHEKQTTLNELGAGRGAALTVLIGVLVVGIAPPIEEFFFRGFFYGAMRTRFSFVPAALISGLVFGAVHATTGVQAVPPLMVLGFALCLSYEATGSILPGICIHAVNNMLAFGSDKQGSWVVGAVVALLVIAACVTLPRRSRTLT